MKTRKKTNFKKNIKIKKKYNKSIKKFNRKYNKFSKKNNRKYNKFSKKNNRKIEGGGFGSLISFVAPKKSQSTVKDVTASVAPLSQNQLDKFHAKIAATPPQARNVYGTDVHHDYGHTLRDQRRHRSAVRTATDELLQQRQQRQQRQPSPIQLSFTPTQGTKYGDPYDIDDTQF